MSLHHLESFFQETKCNGTNICCCCIFPAPTISSGKVGSAIRVNNRNTYGSTKLSFGRHETDCLGNVTLCPNGVTISFWIYMYKQSHMYPRPVDGPTIEIMGITKPSSGEFRLSLYNTTHRWHKRQFIIYNYWHHLAFVYTAKDGFTWYFDGYRYNPFNGKEIYRGAQDFEVGCRGGAHCSKAKYDDLRVWNEAKDEKFIWRLWQL